MDSVDHGSTDGEIDLGDVVSLTFCWYLLDVEDEDGGFSAVVVVWLESLHRANQSLVARKHDFHHTWPSVCQCQRHSEARGERDRASRGILVTLEAFTKLLRQSHLMC